MSEENADAPLPVVLDLDQLSPEALHGLAEEFVTRDGTDYGAGGAGRRGEDRPSARPAALG